MLNSSSILDSCSSIFSCFKLKHRVHPQQPVEPKYSEFFEVTSRRRLRIIHLKPSKTEHVQKENAGIGEKTTDNRVSGEYWFTCWNKPIQANGTCNCSFRKSKKNLNVESRNRFSCTSNDSVRNDRLDYFVEKLITNTMLIAYQEYLKNIIGETGVLSKKNLRSKKGVVNLSYDSDGDEKPERAKPSTNKKTLNLTLRKCRTHNTTNKQKPIVLLLHGIGSSAEVWWNVLHCLVGAGHEVLAPDMVGHGYSSAPTNSAAYTFKNLLKDIILVFDKYIGCSEIKQCIVVGHSFGCSLAGALARYRAQQVMQLVLISGGGPTPLAPLASNNEMLFNCLQISIRPLLYCGIKRTVFFSSRGKHFEVCDIDTTVPSYVLRYISRGQYWPEGDATFHRRILIPTLLVHGMKDTHVTLVQECEMERTIPRSFLEIIPTAGHMCMLETPNQLCHMLLCFINWWNQ